MGKEASRKKISWGKELHEKKENKSSFKTTIIIVSVLIFLAAFLYILSRLYLAMILMLGNDIAIQVTTEKENIFLEHGSAQKIKFDIYTATSPFCSAECAFEFKDLGSNNLVEKNSFKFRYSNSRAEAYIINSTRIVTGQEMYRFDIRCKNTKAFLCPAREESKSKSVLLTVNYDLNDEERKYKEDSKNEILALMQKTANFALDVNELNFVVYAFDKIVNSDNIIIYANNANKKTKEINNTNYNLKDLWEVQDYAAISERILSSAQDLFNVEKEINDTRNIFSSRLSAYNNLIDNLTEAKQTLEYFKKFNAPNLTFTDINNVIKKFNNATLRFEKRENLEDKEELIRNLTRDLGILSSVIINETNCSSCRFANETIISFFADKIKLSKIYDYPQINVSFKEPPQICCLFGKCGECCNDSCKSEKEKFPVILLHGHDFSESISAEYSLDKFQNIQEKLEDDGYLNAGSFLIGNFEKEEKGILGKIRAPLSIKASYYFDIYKNTKKNMIIETKKDNIDTYAIRLKDIISEVKYKTNRDKVVIVAHSMGGLAARRYIQLFSSNDVSKLILIGTPNKGIDGSILNYCPVFGAKLECRDMDKDSLFMDKLNDNSTYGLPVYNIAGIGCKMDSETGDGIVKKSSANLENTENYFVSGRCGELQAGFFHGEMLDADKYPDIYGIIKESLAK